MQSSIQIRRPHCAPCRIVINTELSGIQLRNLQAAWGLPVLDRIGLIIEIFAQRARTREAKLQVRSLVIACEDVFRL